ncbi:MAG TPA: TonB-dependent receptor [Verrucomicrobiae bacterium]|nr:TonB-dependent receptor [Verrucomicrobiae bacterium]
MNRKIPFSTFPICSSLVAIAFLATLFSVTAVFASVFGSVRGVIHDPQHRPVQNAMVMLRSTTSDWSRSTNTNANGEFQFNAVPLGQYTVSVASPGFEQTAQRVIVEADTQPVLHYQLAIAKARENVTVESSAVVVPTDTFTPITIIDRSQIAETPGADRTNGMQMLTDYVPAAYMVHDMLHMRGGHQVEWAVDGVPIPNTNIANNLGPQIDPKDIDYLEVQRGSYDADFGDRTYGIFDIVPRTGFERDRECDLVISGGNFYQTNDQVSCGSHTERSAWYASLNGNRSQYGLMTPIPQTVNDAANGIGGFTSLIFNPDPKNQYRLVGSLRRDYYQIPIDPNLNSTGNQILVSSGLVPSSGLHDAEVEPDAYTTFSWVHTFSPETLLTVSPFYHYNGADYRSGPNDIPVISSVTQTANYAGSQASIGTDFHNNDLQAGVYGFFQHQYNYFNNVYTCQQNCPIYGVPPNPPNYGPSSIGVNGGVAAFFVNDKFKVTPWLTLIAGLRETYFSGAISENSNAPRLGATMRIPHLNWTFRGFYGYFYQAPPLSTATGDLQQLGVNQGFTFAPLHGERDIEWQFGVQIPLHGWTLDADNFETRAHNWLDHNNIGESNIFWPITWEYALIQGWEVTLRSPDIMHRGQFHLAYSNQIAQATSPITGGLIFQIPPGLAPVDHDQRNTLNVGFNGHLPWHAYASTNVYYGSGFTNGLYGTPLSQYPGPYLPSHSAVDLSLGKTFAERYTISVTALNVGNRRVQLDNSLTFGGFHWDEPRQIYGEVRYRFKY